MGRIVLLTLIVLVSQGCLAPVTQRLDETNARLANIERELAASNKTLTSLEKKLRILPGEGEKPDEHAKPRTIVAP